MLLLASLSAWIIFTLPLGFIQPPPTSCILKENHTYVIKSPEPAERMYKREVHNSALFLLTNNEVQKQEVLSRQTRSYHPNSMIGQSPLNVKFASNYDERHHSGLVSPLFSSIVYRTEVLFYYYYYYYYYYYVYKFSCWNLLNLLSAYDVISHHTVAVTQWPWCLITSCCSSGRTQHL